MGLMTSGPAALDGSRPASSFKIPASDISIWGISGTLGLNVPGIPTAISTLLTCGADKFFSIRIYYGIKHMLVLSLVNMQILFTPYRFKFRNI